MIKNEIQLRLTKSRIDQFKEYLIRIEDLKSSQMDERLISAEIIAINGQIEELEKEVKNYSELWNSKIPIPELNSLEQIPDALIKSRISLGLSQESFANLVRLKEQQIQRYESEEYQSASLATLRGLADILKIRFTHGLSIPDQQTTIGGLLRKIKETGIDLNFILDNVLPIDISEELKSANQNFVIDGRFLGFVDKIAYMFKWNRSQILGKENLTLNPQALGAVNFKVRRNVNENRMNTQTFYAHYLALLLKQGLGNNVTSPIPSDPFQINRIISSGNKITVNDALNYVWNLGIPVLALNNFTGVQGMCIPTESGVVITVNNFDKYPERWLFVLFHELWHARLTLLSPGTKEFLIEDLGGSMAFKKPSVDDEIANKFAGAVLLGKNPDDLVHKCLDVANNDISRLKSAVKSVASMEHVSTGVLANVLAYRLAKEGTNWWSSANNLQDIDTRIRSFAADHIIQNIDPMLLSSEDLSFLSRAMGMLEVV